MVQSLKEIVNGVSDVEIYAALKECNMDPNEAVNRLLSQDPFHEVKSKREKKKESKDTTESRPRGGGSTSSRGGRSGTDRYGGRGGSSHYNSSESGGYNGKPKRENGTSSYGSSSYGTSSYTQSSATSYGAPATNTNWNNPPSYSDSVGYENKASTYSAADVPAAVPQQPSSGYQSAWLGAPGQKSMADIVKMGKPQSKPYTAPVPPQPSYDEWDSNPSEVYQQPNVSTDDDWPVMEQPQVVSVQSVSEPPVESENVSQSNLPYESNQYIASQIDEPQAEDEGVYEDHTVPASVTSRQYQDDTSGGAALYDTDVNKNIDSFHPEDYAYEQNEVEEGDASASSISANMQQLNIQEERHVDEPEQDVPSVVIPNHLQVQSAECSHLSFGSFSATMNPGFSGSFGSRQLSKVEDEPAEADIPSARPSETRNPEYYGDESIITSDSNLVNRTGPSSGSYDLSSASQTEVLKQENPEVTHGNQYGYSSSAAAPPGYTFDGTQLLNPAFPQSQTPTQMPNAAPFSNVMQAAYTNSLPNTLAANGHPVRESDLSYSQFPTSQSMATKYGSSVSSTSGITISMEALKTGAYSSSQPTQQTLPGNSLPTGPALPQHLVHPYSQPTLPLGPFANMIGYPFLPQSYTYMPSGFQQAFAGNSTYHQQLGAVLPQYKNSVSVSSLPQSAAVPSGYGSYGNSTAIPGNYQVNQPAGPAGSTLSYDDVLANHYKESQLLSLQQQQQQQQNDNSAMWVQGAGSRAVPANTYYSFQGQNQQQPSGYRQGQQQQQQPSQSYGGAAFNYPNYYQSQTGISQEHQLQQNPRDGSLVGGSQGQPKPQQQSQQLW
ncbi:Kinase-related Protein [Artemisia annua]|uniref:Kinase-related Protein n=1 Tax=Artemisia annua TaxID=35608 RepID=A0A2U1PP45_ARTAN|nr:Kinase-related Protein [Artemisia annua]